MGSNLDRHVWFKSGPWCLVQIWTVVSDSNLDQHICFKSGFLRSLGAIAWAVEFVPWAKLSTGSSVSYHERLSISTPFIHPCHILGNYIMKWRSQFPSSFSFLPRNSEKHPGPFVSSLFILKFVPLARCCPKNGMRCSMFTVTCYTCIFPARHIRL